ncbi:hypothetical protein IPJ72_02615 [Candidatus Peregrinibacteria bacterium]|nr:MAG: hypothetical protein IPJ72_02615 [Candidatus Peregrinibacteria bacterium]
MTENKYNPAYDNKIYQKYSKKTIQNKVKNKMAFCEEYGIPFDKKMALIAVPIALSSENNINLIEKIIPGLIEQPVQLVLLGIGTIDFQNYFSKLSEQFPQQCVIINNEDTEIRRMLAASDMALIPSDNEEARQAVMSAQNFGVVPISLEENSVMDYNPIEETGDGFICNGKSSWNLFATVVRALETFRFPYDWKGIQVNAMEKVEASA